MTNAVELSNVTFQWPTGNAPVLEISHFSVGTGERLLVSGPSGSGKTTLLNLLGGVTIPDAGMVSILGTRLDRLSAAERDSFRADHVGIIFQLFNLVPYLSLVENVLLPCRFSARRSAQATARDGDPVSAARRLLAGMGLPDALMTGRSVTELSVGQQQRVAAARALIGAPELLIADEPTSALDDDARQSFLDLLFESAATEGQTLILVSHDRRMEAVFDRHVSLADLNGASTSGAPG
jgi:putative ABC transport system ATP-binding protein